MAAVTYSPKFAPEVAATAKTGKSVCARLWARSFEARRLQAEREIRMHVSYLPQEMVEHYKKLPFQR